VTCESGYVYSNEFDLCVTTGYGCPYPDLDYEHIPPCTTRAECGPASDGYTISGSECIYEVTCESGYFYDNNFGCITFGYGCSYPDLDYPTGPENCVSRGFCAPQDDGYFIVGTECIYEPPVVG
jgi:hypothetical protein